MTDNGWSRERAGLQEEIRRLSEEISCYKQKEMEEKWKEEEDEEEEDDEISFMGRYNKSNNGDVIASQISHDSDEADIDSLRCIISMMRQTIDQTNQEKELLERRLAAEQERSQMELRSFANTLAGVDELRRAAEVMSREIRRIKVRGYRPRRTDLLGGGGLPVGIGMPGRRLSGDLVAAVAASESMEDAIQRIESHNDSVEERRRMGVVASAAAAAVGTVVADERDAGGGGGGGWGGGGWGVGRGGVRPVADHGEGGFLSFWHRAAGEDDDYEGGGDGRGGTKTGKKAKTKYRRKSTGGGSVLTSFF